MKEFEERLNYFTKIEAVKASDLIINQISEMLREGLLKPGVRLPPERIMARQFGVGRSQVREAIAKLVSLGILKTMPQSGTYVQDMGNATYSKILRETIEKRVNDEDDLIELWGLMQKARLGETLEKRQNSDLEDLVSTCVAKAGKGRYSVDDDLELSLHLSGYFANAIARDMLNYLNARIKEILKKRLTLSKEDQMALCDYIQEFIIELKQNNVEGALGKLYRHNELIVKLAGQRSGRGGAKKS
jgi:GntR family transcriptional repressor for pyruvate dehydrogenase complex